MSDDDIRDNKTDFFLPSTGAPARSRLTPTADEARLRELQAKATEQAFGRKTTLWGMIDAALGPRLQTLPAPVAPAQQPGGKMHWAQPNIEVEVLRRLKAAVPAAAPLVVREYAAPRPGSAGTEGVTAFASTPESDTILWHPVIVLPADGKVTLPFTPGSAPGGYQVLVAGHTPDGRIGAVRRFLPVAPGGASEAGPPVVPSPTNKP